MRHRLLVWVALGLGAVSVACSSPHADTAPRPSHPSDATRAAEPDEGEGVAYFAGGCFWGVEHYMEQIEGVTSVDSGYMGGHVDSPTYEDVSHADTGHVETVRVRFDPARVSYEAVAKRFFEIHDPTQANGQGPDIGPEYRSVVFYASADQKQTTEQLIDTLETRGYDVVTEVRPADAFWPAEAYHQDYYEKNDAMPYCHARVKRFGD